MKSVYERTTLIITEFNTEDVITTSGTPEPPAPTVSKKKEHENFYATFDALDLDPPTGGWF